MVPGGEGHERPEALAGREDGVGDGARQGLGRSLGKRAAELVLEPGPLRRGEAVEEMIRESHQDQAAPRRPHSGARRVRAREAPAGV